MTGAAGLALGTVQWGLSYGIANRAGRPDRTAVAEMLALARNAGVTVLDTARAYGESEQVIGEAVGSDSGWAVLTKLAPDADTPAAAADSLAASRLALRRDRLDAVLLHRARHRTAAGGSVWDVLRRERDAGRVGALGVSAGDPDEAWVAVDDPDVEVVQVAASLLDQRLSRTGYFDRAAGRGKRVFVRSVFLQGAAHLAPDGLPAHLAAIRDPIAAVRRWAATRGASPGLAFLAFAAALPGVSVLVGCETPGQLAANLRDWGAAQALAGPDIADLARTVPDLPADVLNPALWPPT